MRKNRATGIVAAFGVIGLVLMFPIESAGAVQTVAMQSTLKPFAIGEVRATLDDPGSTPNAFFGDSVAESGSGPGSTLIVGAFGTDSYAGSAYIYVKGSSGWPTTPDATLTDPPATANDDFGYSVAISGDTAVVGAAGVVSPSGPISSPGAAYIYVKGSSGWPTTPTATLADPAGTSNDVFGYSVAVSSKTVVVGAPRTHFSEGATYIYTRVASGWPAMPTSTLADPGNNDSDEFGNSVAVSGKTVVVGTPGAGSNSGAAYVYVKGSSDSPHPDLDVGRSLSLFRFRHRGGHFRSDRCRRLPR
ncbi:MAG: hypothetical protein WAM97_13690 [Acidimicrobiales bacterium]